MAVDQEGRIVGVVVYSLLGDSPGIASLGVVRDRRCEGIGTRLKQGVMARFAAEMGAGAKVFSEVHRNNGPMLAINDKLGVKRELNPDNRAHWLCAVEVEPEP